MTSAPARHASALGVIQILKRKTGTLKYVQKGGNQSEADRHGVSLSAYIHALYGLAIQTAAREVLMIGCGGGTLATMLARAGKRVTAVDIDPVSFKIARAHFNLPRSVKCHVADGLAFMRTTRRRFDLLIVDAFLGEAVPDQFTGDEFCAAARRVVRDTGALLFNVCLDDRRDRTADKIAARLVRNGWPVRLVDQRGETERNAIVAAGEVGALRAPRPLIVPEADADRVARETRTFQFRRRRAA
jgi:spermidine synthase